MEKVSQISFILEEDKFSKLIFRFLPQLSSCHSFNDNPPKSWQEVYKVYYAYEIVEQWFDEGQNNEDVLFSTSFDECSIIDCIGNYLIENTPIVGKVKETCMPFGAGVTWELSKTEDSDDMQFVLWKHNNMGYQFWLPQEQCRNFGQFLIDCCEYMLAHGEPI